jgi:glycyl-tRNA synthetase
VAVFPLLKNRPELVAKARGIFTDLRATWAADYDQAGAIGRRYRRQDEIGTPFCVTVDFDTLEQDTVTVRERDSMKQERIPVSELRAWLHAKGI